MGHHGHHHHHHHHGGHHGGGGLLVGAMFATAASRPVVRQNTVYVQQPAPIVFGAQQLPAQPVQQQQPPPQQVAPQPAVAADGGGGLSRTPSTKEWRVTKELNWFSNGWRVEELDPVRMMLINKDAHGRVLKEIPLRSIKSMQPVSTTQLNIDFNNGQRTYTLFFRSAAERSQFVQKTQAMINGTYVSSASLPLAVPYGAAPPPPAYAPGYAPPPYAAAAAGPAAPPPYAPAYPPPPQYGYRV